MFEERRPRFGREEAIADSFYFGGDSAHICTMRSGISVQAYAALSAIGSAVVVLNTWMQYEQFYPTLVALANSKSSLFVRATIEPLFALLLAFGFPTDS